MEHQRRLFSKENAIDCKHTSVQFRSFFLPNPCFKEDCISAYMLLSKERRILKCFMKNFGVFTDNKYNIRTKKIKQLFKLKRRNPHPSCLIYGGL